MALLNLLRFTQSGSPFDSVRFYKLLLLSLVRDIASISLICELTRLISAA